MTFSFRDAERRLWLDGAEAYRDLMHPDCVMVLPMPDPVLAGQEIVAAIESGPRWDEVTFRKVRELDSGDAHVFAYLAEGRRGDEPPYRAGCLSVWSMTGDGWRLLSHQQTPMGG